MNSTIGITEDLIEQCKAGKQAAFNQVYSNCARGVYSSILRIVKNREEAEDLLQEAFISAFQSIQSYRGEAALFGWIKKIGINKALNSVKKKALQYSDVAVEDVEIIQEEANWKDAKMEVAQIAEKIQELPDGFRVVITLYLFEGYSHKEIAAELGISESTSKTQYVRGKKKLRELLN